jgi:hypothetical protein
MVKFGFGSRAVAFTAAALMAGMSGSAMATVSDAKGDAAPPAEKATAPTKPAKPVRYCVQGVVTGTILPAKVCKTREQWLKEGLDPTAPQE